MNIDLKSFAIGSITVITLIILIIINFDKIILLFGTLLKLFSFINLIKRKGYTLVLEGKINDICKNLSPELFDKSLRIKWLGKDELDKAFSLNDKKEIIVYIVDKKNPNKNILGILQEFTSGAFIPNLKGVLDYTFVHVNEQYIISKIIKRYKNNSLTVYYNNNVTKQFSNDEKNLTKTIFSLDRTAYYFPCFVDSLSYVDENIPEFLLDDNTKEEIYNFTNFLYNIATKETWEEAELTFMGNIFKISVILVAKKETLDLFGISSHVNRIERVMNQGVDRIYLRGIGKNNIINVKRIMNTLRRFKSLNKIYEKDHDITDKSGKSHSLLMVIYDNYLYKKIDYGEQQKEEITKLLNEHIPEIENGSIKILEVAREKGIVTKVLLRTDVSHINVVACCIGTNFERKNTIESKLKGENIYFIEYSDDPEELISNSLIPLEKEYIKAINIASTEHKNATVTVVKDKVGLAIGKLGIYIKLAERLIGWNIEIQESLDTNDNSI